MVDFRYHALSLVAVFLALGIGIVLGVTVGDSLVSDADRNLRDSLRGDLTEAREQARDAEALGRRRDDVIDELAPQVAAGRLRGDRVALIAIGDLPIDVSDGAREAVEMAGGDVVRIAELRQSPEGELLVPMPPQSLGARARGQGRWGTQLARLIRSGAPLLRRLARNTQPRWFSGSTRGPVDAVVVYRHPPPEDQGDEERRLQEGFEDGVFHGLRDSALGVEAVGTEPSQVAYYDDRGVASVDNVDVPAGRLALVLLLEKAVVAEATDDPPAGSYGYKDSAERALPDLSD